MSTKTRCPRCLDRFAADQVWCPRDDTKLVRDLSDKVLTGSALGRWYTLGVPIGRGAFGAVFRAKSNVPATAGETCAIKELSKYNLDSSSLLGGSRARGVTADSPLLAAPK